MSCCVVRCVLWCVVLCAGPVPRGVGRGGGAGEEAAESDDRGAAGLEPVAGLRGYRAADAQLRAPHVARGDVCAHRRRRRADGPTRRHRPLQRQVRRRLRQGQHLHPPRLQLDPPPHLVPPLLSCPPRQLPAAARLCSPPRGLSRTQRARRASPVREGLSLLSRSRWPAFKFLTLEPRHWHSALADHDDSVVNACVNAPLPPARRRAAMPRAKRTSTT
eukprot:1421506-Rhodomonas_salina.4